MAKDPEKTENVAQSVFEVPSAVLRNIEDALQFVRDSTLIKSERTFLEHLLLFASEISPDAKTVSFPYGDFQSYLKTQKAASGRLTILRRADKLVQNEIFDQLELDISEHNEGNLGGRPRKRFVLKSIHKPNFKTGPQHELELRMQGRSSRRTKSIKAVLNHLKQSDAQFIKEFSQAKPVTESLFTGILDRAMRFSTLEKVEGNRITTAIQVRKARIIVQATTQTGESSEIAALPDQRVIRAVITEIAHVMEMKLNECLVATASDQGSLPFDEHPMTFSYDEDGVLSSVPNSQALQNSFYIDVVGLAKRMGYSSPHSGSTRELINRALRRLYETNFRIVISNPESKEAQGLMHLFGLSDTSTDFRFITELKSQFDSSFYDDENFRGTDHQRNMELALSGAPEPSEADDQEAVNPYRQSELKRIRAWRISIDSHLFNRLQDKDVRSLYAAHEEIMREPNGLAHSLYNLMTSILGRTNQALKGQNERVYFQSLSVLHNTLWATRRYDRFEQSIIDLIKRHADPATWDDALKLNSASMFGYVFTLMTHDSSGQLWLRVARDRNDRLNGDFSYHNQRLSAEMAGS